MSELREHGEATGINLLLDNMSNWRSQLKIEFNRWREQDEQAYEQIKELIQKPQVTDKWIEEKAVELNNKIILESHIGYYYGVAKHFIRSLVEEIRGK